ncbi:[protein-PII] uridylyltransferase [Dongia sp.]|uniref:[protein-PII] uridylyltransferase n=1 Tax=Dongia sp. TaxID=1977262 RepID=UPI0035B26085
MNAIDNQRAVIDRRRLMAELDALAEGAGDAAAAGAELSAILKRYLAAGREEIQARFMSNSRGAQAGLTSAHEASFLVDQLLRGLFDFTTQKAFPLGNPTVAERLSLIAVGGYGRGELAPHSDIDILFLLPYKMSPYCEQVVEFMLYRLWDLGLKVGQAARSVEECLRQAEGDLTIRTTLLEARYVWGDQQLFEDFRAAFAKRVIKGHGEAFYHEKLAERQGRHKLHGGSRYELQPNIKDGKGGLRDLQTLLWLARFVVRADSIQALVEQGLLTNAERATYDKAFNFLWTLRCHLHYLTGRGEERLTFDLQPEIARRLGYTDHAGSKGVERLMKHYFLVVKSVGGLTRYVCAGIESQCFKKPLLRLPTLGILRKELGGFPLENGRLTIPRADHFNQHPIDLIRIFLVAQQHDVEIHPSAMTAVSHCLRLVDQLREDAAANALFLELLTSTKGAELSLRRLNEVGVLGRFIPDFGRVVAQMQYDMYHSYTVDEHTIFAIGILARIERGELKDEAPIASQVVKDVLSRRVLYLAVLLHDIAKGRAGDHSLLGGDVAEKLCPRLGLTAEETEQVAWLVRYHLLMSNTAFRRDIDDPKTIADFVDLVQSPERLRLLLVLTVADIRAVGPKTWNGWKAQLLRELYHRAEDMMMGGLTEAREDRAVAALSDLKAELKSWPDEDWTAHTQRGHPSYWLAFPAPTLARHARMMREADREQRALSVEFHVDRWRAMTEITIYTADAKGLFSQLAGAVALSGASIVDARIFTLRNGKALDTFFVQDTEGGPFDQPARLAKLTATIRLVLEQPQRTLAQLDALPQLANPAARNFPIIPRVLIDNRASATHTVVEVNGRDRRGLLHRLTAALTRLNFQIFSAKVSTFGHRAVDVFYVKDQFGLKVENDERLKALRAALMDVLTEIEEPAEGETRVTTLDSWPPRPTKNVTAAQ